MSWYQEYKRSLKLSEVEESLDVFLYRPLSFLVVKLVYHTQITPNHLTLAAIAMGIVSGCLYAFGKPDFIVAGALFFLLFNIFDCSDGQLARLKNNGTAIGKIMDGVADYAASVAVYVGIAIGFAGHQDNPLPWLILLAVTGICSGIHSVLVDFYRSRFLDYYTLRKDNFDDTIREIKNALVEARHKGRKLEQTAFMMYLKYTRLQRFLTIKRSGKIAISATPEEYYRKNRILMRLWLLIGPTMQITNIIVCSFLQRIDLFMWIVLIVFNGLAILLWIIQQMVDRTYRDTKK